MHATGQVLNSYSKQWTDACQSLFYASQVFDCYMRWPHAVCLSVMFCLVQIMDFYSVKLFHLICSSHMRMFNRYEAISMF